MLEPATFVERGSLFKKHLAIRERSRTIEKGKVDGLQAGLFSRLWQRSSLLNAGLAANKILFTRIKLSVGADLPHGMISSQHGSSSCTAGSSISLRFIFSYWSVRAAALSNREHFIANKVQADRGGFGLVEKVTGHSFAHVRPQFIPRSSLNQNVMRKAFGHEPPSASWVTVKTSSMSQVSQKAIPQAISNSRACVISRLPTGRT